MVQQKNENNRQIQSPKCNIFEAQQINNIPTYFGESAEHVVSFNSVFIPLLLKVEVLLEVTRNPCSAYEAKTTKNNHQLIHYKTWPLEIRTLYMFFV